MIEHILVAIDGSEHARHATDVAADLGRRFGAKVTLLHVLAEPADFSVPPEVKAYSEIEHIKVTRRDLLEAAGQELLETARSKVVAAGVADCETVLESGDPTERIVARAAADQADLIVMGRRGLGDLAAMLLGSVSHKVSQAAACSCLTVK